MRPHTIFQSGLTSTSTYLSYSQQQVQQHHSLLEHWYICYVLCVFCAAGVDFTSSIFFIILEPGHTTVCTNGTLFEDSLVEGTESFFLVMTSNNPDIILNGNSGINSIQTQIFIEDNTGIC